MAKTQSSKTISNPRAGMIDEIKTIRRAIADGATGYLFAAVMPDGQLRWFAAGALDNYDMGVANTAMHLHQKTLGFVLGECRFRALPSATYAP